MAGTLEPTIFMSNQRLEIAGKDELGSDFAALGTLGLSKVQGLDAHWIMSCKGPDLACVNVHHKGQKGKYTIYHGSRL